MKAIVVRAFGGPDVLQLGDTPDPTPGPHQVVVRVRAAGVNPADTYIRNGAYALKPTLPYTPGFDVAGTIERVGSDVTLLRTGERVYGETLANGGGGYAELAVCEETRVYRLPDRISFQQGAGLGVPYGTAWRALFVRAQAVAGDIVLVHGASGGVGIAAVQIARAHGMRVIGTAGTEKGVALVRAQGAHDVLNHREPDYLKRLVELTGRHGVDIVLEMLANVNLDHDLDILAFRGRVVIVGNRGRVEIDPRKTMGKDAAILGMTQFNADAAELRQIHAGIAAGLENGTLNPVVGKELPLADAAKAHVAVMEPGAYGKIVLIP